MTSQGQRFRRKALRRGYKVDEVDEFLDRVEATLNGEVVGAPPVRSQEVHDIVFRVRFGGYDEWQVDLHLDRIERQLAEAEEHGGYGRPAPAGDRMPPPERAMDRMGPPERMPMDRMGPPPGFGEPPGMPPRDDRMGPPPGFAEPPGMPPRDDRMAPAMRDDRMMPPGRDDRPGMPPRPAPAAAPGYGRYDEPPTQPGRFEPPMQPPPGRFDPPTQPGRFEPPIQPPPGRFDAPGQPGPYDDPRYEPFEPGRHGKTEMTTELRMPPDLAGPGGGFGGPGPGGPGFGGPGFAGGPGGPGGPGLGGPGGPGGGSGEVARVDQLRRSFRPRRFGSGYDPMQVDRLFEGILAAVAGHSPVPVNEAELDPSQFNLVPGGYYEAEVEQALREVRDIIRRR